jgi:hypothetical protein
VSSFERLVEIYTRVVLNRIGGTRQCDQVAQSPGPECADVKPAPHGLARLQALCLRGPKKNVGLLKLRRIYLALGSDAQGTHVKGWQVIGIGHSLRFGGD